MPSSQVSVLSPQLSHDNYFNLASCCNEALKFATTCAPYMDNYMMYIGTDGVYTLTFEHEKRKDCPACGGETMDVHVNPEWTLERLIEWLTEKQDM